MEANYGENEIKSLLLKVRIFNKEIGAYQIFAITENFDYTVKLSNGRILIKLKELQDDEQDALTPTQLTAIAKRFNSSTSPAKNEQQTVQPQSQAAQKTQSPKKKSLNGKIVLLVIIVLIVILGGFAILDNLNNGGVGYGASESYQEKKMTIAEIERSQPTDFLFAEGTYRENFLGNKIKVKCIITNKATVVTYKDPVVRITYYTKTNTKLGSKEFTAYEIFPPNSTNTIQLKIDNYENVNSISWDVISAIPY